MFFSACNAVRRIFFESAFMQAKTKKVRRKVSLRRTFLVLLRHLLFDKLPAVARRQRQMCIRDSLFSFVAAFTF